VSLLKKLEISKKLAENINSEEKKGLFENAGRDPYADLKTELHKKIVDELKELKTPEKEDKDFIRKHIEQMVESIIEADANHIPRLDRMRISDEIYDEVAGYGPITPLLNDREISEIMVNGPDQVYIERNGQLELSDVFFRDNDHVMNIIDRIVSPIGRRIDESMPMVDARLPDGSRVNAIIPPLSLTGPVVTIRKFFADPLMIEDLIEFNTLTPEMAQFIEACVKARLNVVVSGGTGSGKTTTLNVLSSFIPVNERIVTIEDAAELALHQPHVVTLESRPPNIEGKGAITIRDLVRNALRMRPDRIIVGEVKAEKL
jgi:pilus assembly protein CpaF